LILAGNVFGQGQIIKERAKELRDQNNVRQGVPPPTQTAKPAAAQPAASAPSVSPALTTFQADLAALKMGTPASAEQKQKLGLNLLAATQGAKPALPTMNRFIEKLTSAVAEKPLSATALARFTQELDAILNPGKYPQAKKDAIFTDMQAIFQDNGLNRTKASAIVDDVKMMSADISRGGAR